jgi:sulfite reductase (NADPH) flavoprotein alpha-component
LSTKIMISFDRSHPFLSHVQERALLSRPGSTKETYHLSLPLHPSMTYQPGDCVAILPSNAPEEVEAILHLLQAKENSVLRDFFSQKANLHKPHPALIRKVLGETHSELGRNCTPADLIASHRNVPIAPDELSRLFLPLLPRLYSIASSQLVHPHEMHLMVGLVQYHIDGQERKGVASNFLCKEVLVGKTPIPLYLQPSHNFLLPEDPNASIILIGSGTGLAPYRAFMQHRQAIRSTGRSWLFLGERNRATDYYYQDFWEELQKEGQLHLTLAFSRDSSEKIYVQHRMWEERRNLWAWIQQGAQVYVCGEAHHMAKEVEVTFHRIVMSEGNLSDEGAHHFIKNLRAQKCYRMDVY